MLQICVLEIPQTSLIIWAKSLQRKTLTFFLTSQGNHFTPLSQVYCFKRLVLIADISTSFWFISHSVCHMVTREHFHVISENLKFTGSIYRSIKCQKTIYLVNILLTVANTIKIYMLTSSIQVFPYSWMYHYWLTEKTSVPLKSFLEFM